MKSPVRAAFDIATFQSYLKTASLGQAFELHASVPSTMPLAAAAASTPESHGLVVMAEEQTAGVGRRQRAWVSKPNGNLYVSFVWCSSPEYEVKQAIAEMLKLTMAMGIAVVNAAGNQGVVTVFFIYTCHLCENRGLCRLTSRYGTPRSHRPPK